jgi:hypothetical protein
MSSAMQSVACRGPRMALSTPQARWATRAGLALGAHQGGGERRLALGQAVRRLGEQRARQRVDAHQLAAQGTRFRYASRIWSLRQLASSRVAMTAWPSSGAGCARRCPAQVVVEQAGQLHGQRAGAARARVPQVGPGGGGDGAPVHSAVLVKALVLRQHQRVRSAGEMSASRTQAPRRACASVRTRSIGSPWRSRISVSEGRCSARTASKLCA